MAKPQKWQLDPDNYPIHFLTQTRFQDVDILGHINNVAMAALFENGRSRFSRSMGDDRKGSGERWLVAGVEIAYVAEAHYPDDMLVTTGIGRIGSTSWDICQGAFQNGKCVGTCTATIVLTNEKGPLKLSDKLRVKLAADFTKPFSV